MTAPDTDRGAPTSPSGLLPLPSEPARGPDGPPPVPAPLPPGTGPEATPGIGTQELADLLGISYRMVDYYVRQGYLRPEGRQGYGYPRRWPAEEVGVATRMAVLINGGLRAAVAAEVAREYPDAQVGVSLARVPAPDQIPPQWHPSRTPHWTDLAECTDADPEEWFPETGENGSRAKRICARCRVREECLDYAVSSPDLLDGIWGGTTEHERRPLRKQYRARAS